MAVDTEGNHGFWGASTGESIWMECSGTQEEVAIFEWCTRSLCLERIHGRASVRLGLSVLNHFSGV